MINDVFKALADPARRKILELLHERDMNAGDIAAKFSMSKPSISHHLNVLKHADLVLAEKKGQNIFYSINETAFQDGLRFMLDLLHFNKKEEIENV